MTESIRIQPVAAPLDARIRPPGSKSITNRALVCAALAEGTSMLSGALDSEDTQAMVEALGQLGIVIEQEDSGRRLVVTGCGGAIPRESADLFAANSGTTVRFLTALVTLGQGRFRLDGIARMRQRPITDLLDALGQLGADARSENDNGCPPVIVNAHGLPGGQATIAGGTSSQYLSGLLLSAPYAEQGVEVQVEGPLVSRPYVEMTSHVMAAFGVNVDAPDENRFSVSADCAYHRRDYTVEPDASAASYFWAAAAIAGGRVVVEGLSQSSIQGDIAFCECLGRMGCRVEYGSDWVAITGGSLTGIDVDMNAISDTVQTLAVVALFANRPTRIRGVAHNRHKETDRIGDLAAELRKLGAKVDEHDDGVTIVPGPLRSAQIDTYNDHRMAMSLALAGLRVPDVVIMDPNCVAKTYPGFFRDLSELTSNARA